LGSKYVSFRQEFAFFNYKFILGLCATTTYTKSNGNIACGYDLQPGLTWFEFKKLNNKLRKDYDNFSSY